MARGPLRIQQFQALANLGTSVGGTSGMVAAEAEALDATARRLGRTADRAAAREGEIAGTQAALEGKPGLRNSGSIYGDSFDRAAISTYADQLDTRLYTEAEALAQKHEADPAGLAAGFDALRQSMLENDVVADPRLQAAFTRSFERVKLGHLRSAERAARTRADQAQAAAAQEAVSASRRNLERQAYALGMDPEGLAATEEETAKVTGIVSRAEASGAIAPGSAARLTSSIAAERAEAHLKGEFDRLPAAERKGFIDRMTEDFKAGKGLAASFDLDGFQRLTGAFERQINADRVAVTQTQNAMKTQASAILRLAGEGYGIAPEQWATIETVAASVPDGEATVRALRTEADFFHTLAGRSPMEAEAAISAMKAQTAEAGATTVTAERNRRADEFLKNQVTQLREDPLGWAARAGVASVAPIDFTDPATLSARGDAAEAVAEHYGTAPVYLRPQERAQLARAIDQGGETMLATVNAIGSGFGPRAPAVLRELSGSAPVLAHVGGLALNGGSPEFAADVAEAIAMRRDPNFKAPSWKPQPFRDMAAQVLGPALAAAPQALRAAETAAKTAYEARAYRRGLSPALGDDDSKEAFKRALQEAMGATFDRAGTQFGGVGTHGGGWFSRGTPVVVPPDVRADRFSDVIDAIRDEDLPADILTARELSGARLLSVGPGRYRVALGDPDSEDPQFVVAPDGRAWTLDLNALQPALRSRVPGAYK